MQDIRVSKLMSPLPCSVTIERVGVLSVCGRDAYVMVCFPERLTMQRHHVAAWYCFPICNVCSEVRVIERRRVDDG